MSNRPQKEVMYLKYTFSSDERLRMGDDLASAHNRIESIETEEAVVKAQFKERKASVEQSVTSLSRNLSTGFEMRNIDVRLDWDTPNVNEVQYVRTDTGEVVKTRPFTEAERQQDLPLDADQSAENIAQFFNAEKPPLEGAVLEGVVVADGPPEKAEPVVPEPNEATNIAKAKKALDKM